MFRYTLYHSTDKYILSTDPKGWDAAELGITRSPKYHGMNYNQILALSFICGSGKEFIDNIYNTLGVDEEIKITVEESCECVETITNNSYSPDYSPDYEQGGSSLDCNYQMLFEGMLDLFSINILDQETQVPLIEQGLNQKLTSRIETKVELFSNKTIGGQIINDITAPYNLNLHSKAVTALGNWQFVDYMEEVLNSTVGFGLYLNLIPVFIEKDGLYFEDNESNPIDAIFYNQSNASIQLKVNIKSIGGIQLKRLSPSNSVNLTTIFGIRIGTDPISPGFNHKFIPDQVFNYDGTYKQVDLTVTDEVTITVPAGNFVFISMVVYGTASEAWEATSAFTSLSVTATYVSLALPSVSKAQYIFESLARIGESMFDKADCVRSSYYGRINATPYEEIENGCGSFGAFTSGVMIRQYPTVGEKPNGIQMSCNETFETLDAIDDIGIGFEKWGTDYKLRWERKGFFYQNLEIIKLEHVPNIKRSVAQEYAFNDILLGFAKWQVTSANGLDEYCSRSQYTNGMKAVSQQLVKSSPYIGSAYILEQVRRMPYNENVTTDTDYDNDNFIIALNRSLGYDGAPTNLVTAEKNENFTLVSNVLSPETTYNLRYTVSKNLLRNIPSITPIVTKYSSRNVNFTYGEGNKFIVTQDTVQCPSYFNGNPLAGNQDITWIASGEKPLFIAEYLEFQYPITREQYLLIKDAHENPTSLVHNGYITVSNEKETIKGYLIDLKYKQKTGLSTFKLIRKYD